MASSKRPTPPAPDTRTRILDAAERLMRQSGDAEFTMRDLAAAAGLSFATPFNQFGSKAAIMQTLSARRIELMAERFAASAPPPDMAGRVLAAVRIAVGVLLAEPVVNRLVIGSLGAPTGEPGQVAARSRALWAMAVEGGTGVRPGLGDLARNRLPDQLALGFRGCISFWVAGEIMDDALPARACAVAGTLLLGFVEEDARARLLAFLGEAESAET